MTKVVYGEYGYLSMLKEALNGDNYPDRTGVGCTKTFDWTIIWGYDFPFSTVRPMGIRNAWTEMKLFLSGDNDTKKLEEKGIMFWKGNTSREFLDARGLQHLPEGSLGSAYSKQFRDARGVDQLANLVNELSTNPFGRRHAIDLWGVGEQYEMPLLPCWYRSNWYCTKKQSEGVEVIELHLVLDNRSLDVLFGYHQAAMQYKLLQIAIANLLGYEVGTLTTRHIDCHVYDNQREYVMETLTRPLGESGEVKLPVKLNSLDSLLSLSYDDFLVVGYNPNRDAYKAARPEMAA